MVQVQKPEVLCGGVLVVIKTQSIQGDQVEEEEENKVIPYLGQTFIPSLFISVRSEKAVL